MIRVVVATVCTGMLAGCLSGPPVRGPDGMTQAERIAELERRVQRLDNQAEAGQMMELMQRVDALHAELRLLRGEVERLGHDGESLTRRQRELYLDLDRRLQNLEAGGGGGNGASMMPPPSERGSDRGSVQVPLSHAAVASDAADAERGRYEAAIALLRAGRYPQAGEAFQQYLTSHPEGRYADNAQYWLGEVHYVTRDYAVALAEFGKVLERFPDSQKVPDALLKIGYVHYELQHWDDARNTLTDAATRAQGTTVARLAEQRLQRMRQEGR